MYCPNCHKTYKDARFCPDCGVTLVEEQPRDGSIHLNLGDANAISGGVHMKDSHDIHNIDQRVISTNNISNVTNNITQMERQKSEAELQQEHRIQFLELCRQVYDDGILTNDEKNTLEMKRIELNLDEHTANQIIESASKASHRKTALTAKDALTINLIKQLIKDNDVQRLKTQLSRLKALSKTYQVEEVNFICNLLLVALQPEELIDIYESQPTDEYWQTFWVSVAYLKINDVASFEEASARLAYFNNYRDGNELLLQVLSLSHDFGIDNEIVQDTLNTLTEGSLSSELVDFWEGICQCVHFTKKQVDKAALGAVNFYIDHVIPLDVSQDTDEKRPELLGQIRKEAEDEAMSIMEARKQKTAVPRTWLMAIGDAISFDEVEKFWNVTGKAVFSDMRVEEPTVKSILKFLSTANIKDDSLVLFHPQKAELLGYSRSTGVGILYFISRDENKYYSQYATAEMVKPALKDYFQNGNRPAGYESWSSSSFTDILSR